MKNDSTQLVKLIHQKRKEKKILPLPHTIHDNQFQEDHEPRQKFKLQNYDMEEYFHDYSAKKILKKRLLYLTILKFIVCSSKDIREKASHKMLK